MSNFRDAKERILRAATDLLDQESDVERITVKKIAELAGVGVGTINYQFHSKDELISAASLLKTTRLLEDFLVRPRAKYPDPSTRLKAMLKNLFDLDPVKEKLARYMLLMKVQQGNLRIPLYMVPILKEIFGEEKEELPLRILALQMLQPLVTAAISPEAFQLYSGVDIYDKQAREGFIDTLVDNLIKES